MHRFPLAAPSRTLCWASTRSGFTPGSGLVALPGFIGVAAGKGEMRIPPVSVCHQVSTTGQRPSPTIRQYHSHASGLIGSPTVPRSRSDLREYRLDRKSTRLNSSHLVISYAVFCLKKKNYRRQTRHHFQQTRATYLKLKYVTPATYRQEVLYQICAHNQKHAMGRLHRAEAPSTLCT